MPLKSTSTPAKMSKTTTKTNSKTTTKLAKSSKKAKVVSQKSVEPVASVPEKVAAPVPTASLVQQQIDLVGKNIVKMREGLSALNAEYRTLTKLYARERRETERILSKRSGGKRSGNSKPSGFAKPGYISPELCNFLGKPNGTEMARTDVTRFLTTYIKDHDLQNKENKKEIICDAALSGLLKPNKDDIITYFNLQSYMKRHYEEPGLLNA